MAIATYNSTILGTAYPWEIGASTPNIGTPGTLVAYNTQNCDGSATAGATASQNAAYLYGKAHAHAGETGPTLITVAPGNVVQLQYTSGFVQTFGTGAGDSGPGGSPVSSGTSPLPTGGCDAETLPSNVISGRTNFNTTGTVNTSGTTVTLVSGPASFNNAMLGLPIWINGTKFFVSTITSATTLTLTATAGTQTGVTFFFWGASTAIGGLVGAFTDSSNNVLTVFDFGSQVGNLTFAITTAVETAGSVVTLTGTYASTIQYAVGTTVFLTGLTGTFTYLNNQVCTVQSGGSTTTIIISDPTNHGTQASAATAGNALGGQFTVVAPANAAHLSLGINDTQLWDNTGSFLFKIIVFDSTANAPGAWLGSTYPFWHFPHGHSGDTAFTPNVKAGMSDRVTETVPSAQVPTSPFAKIFTGQLFPRGAQNTGGNVAGTGQNFPY